MKISFAITINYLVKTLLVSLSSLLFMMICLWAWKRWKFVNGTEEYKEMVLGYANKKKDRDRMRKIYAMSGVTPCIILLVILIFIALIRNIWYHFYEATFFCLAAEMLFCFILYLLIRK